MSTAEPSEPEEFGPYVVYERLGMGGMATVHRAKKRGIAGFERGVALKRLLPHLAEDQEFIHSFVREAKLASLLMHSNIAQIYEFGRVGAIYYIAMEHVDGIDVRKILRYARRSGEVVPLPVILSILAELCDALEYAHTFVDEHGEHQGIIHRDVSPSNLIVANSGHLKVIDFGIAKASSRQHHTESGRVKGKLGYMSPEAAIGKIYGPASDVFSAAVVAYELLTTHPLFSSKTDYETLLKIHHAEVPAPSKLNAMCPPDLDEAVLAALTRAPEDRTQSAGAFRAALDDVASRAGMRLSSREVFDWLAGVASDSWGGASRSMLSRSQSQQHPSISGSQMRPLPLPPPADAPFARPRSGQSIRTTSVAHAAALADLGQTPSVGGALTSLSRPNHEDDLIADIAWGGEPTSASEMRHPVPESSSVKPSPQSIGSQGSGAVLPIPIARSRSLSRIVAAGILFAGVAIAVFLATRGAKKTPVPVPATLKFLVQPADAIIEIGGQEVSRRSPHLAPLEPGLYSISIHREGYKPWTSDVTVRAGEEQAIRVALAKAIPAKARVTLGSQRPGLAISIDGQPTAQVTPAQLEVDPGDHSITVVDPEDPTRRWTHQFVAAADENYTFEATLERVDPPGQTSGTDPERTSGRRRDPPRRTVVEDEAESFPRTTSGKDRERDKDRVPSTDPVPVDAAPVERPSVLVPAVTTAPTPTTPTLPDKLTAAPVRVPVIAATSVSRISGSIPELRARGGGKDSYNDILAKLCIDERGRVTSAEMVRAAPEISSDVQRALRTWRYKPYSSQGKPSPACFAVSMRVVVRPSN
jgi:eukaryotic-like serine/threonine-protein kinase